MTGVNKVILVGNVGKNPDVVTFPSEGAAPVKKASFPLATTEYRRSRDNERVEITEWHNVVCWRGLADVAERILTKGAQIYVEGRLQSRTWEDKEGSATCRSNLILVIKNLPRRYYGAGLLLSLFPENQKPGLPSRWNMFFL